MTEERKKAIEKDQKITASAETKEDELSEQDFEKVAGGAVGFTAEPQCCATSYVPTVHPKC
jgi:hypothetical protein